MSSTPGDITSFGEVEAKQLVVPRTLSAPSHLSNKYAFDWGWHSLLAFASYSNVVVVDTKNYQLVQSLCRSKDPLVKVLWTPNTGEKIGLPKTSLVTADVMGCITLWDVYNAKVISCVQDGNKPILAMEWIENSNKKTSYLAAIHSQYSFIVWDMEKGQKLWKKTFTNSLNGFNFDPFDSTKLAFLCSDCILFVDSFTVDKIPSSNGRKLYISTPRVNEETIRTKERLKKLMRGLVIGDKIPNPGDAMTIVECLQLIYHKSLRNHILLVYPRDILLIDLFINMTVGVISIDKIQSPFIQVISCSHRDILYCLHENGSIGVRARRRGCPLLPTCSPFDTPLESFNNRVDILNINASEKLMWYEQRCQSDSIRQTKGLKMYGITACPVTEKYVALVLSNGKILFYELEKLNESSLGRSHMTLCDIFQPSTSEKNEIPVIRLVMNGMFHNCSSIITVIRMCQYVPSSNENAKYLLAVGLSNGHILLYNVITAAIYKEFSVHNNSVRGIEWCDSCTFLSWSHIETVGSKIKNELILTNILTGNSKHLTINTTPEKPIDFIRISPLRQYFVIVKKGGTLELWNLKKMSCLRYMPENFPTVAALEWSPSYVSKGLFNKKIQEASGSSKEEKGSLKEHLVFCDNDSLLYHFTIENNTIRDGIKISPQNVVAPVSSLAFKNNKIVQADIDGLLNIWDIKIQVSRAVNTGRSGICKILFSPGRSNLKLLVLYTDGGVDLYDLKQPVAERIAQVKCPKDISKVTDIDWASSQVPILVTQDKFIYLTNSTLTQYYSAINDSKYEEKVYSLSFIPSDVIKEIIMHYALEDTNGQEDIKFPHRNDSNYQIGLLPLEQLQYCTLGVAERSLVLSIILAQLNDIRFWSVVLYYLQEAAIDIKSEPEIDYYGGSKKFINKYPMLRPLDTNFDYLCDSYTFQNIYLQQMELYEWTQGDQEHTDKVIERLILLGLTDKAVQLLLETSFTSPNYYIDSIKACLVAAAQNTESSQSTIKLVATNFIANGKIWDGVQLLCLIGKGSDACRYLMASGLNDGAIWLAKSTLPMMETLEIIKRRAQHLKNTGNSMEGVLLMISQKQFDAAIEMLLEIGCKEKGILLGNSCRHFGIPIIKGNLLSELHIE